MTTRFHPQLINNPLGDPGLYVELMFEKRAILFDLGELVNLASRKLLRVSEVFVTHMHLDHFCGFDQLLRVLLGRDHTLQLFGPEGLVDAVSHKLASYTWNLVDKYNADLTLVVTEMVSNDLLRTLEFHCRAGFRPQNERIRELASDRLLAERGFSVRAVALDHQIPCLAFALEERAHVNIWKNRIEALGLRVGPWLRHLKEAILRDDPDDTIVRAEWKEGGRVVERTLPLGELRGRTATVTPGVKIAYVVDAVGSPENIEKIVALVKNATILYIEAAFLHEDETRARERYHLTARQAGSIARAAGVHRLITLHYSPRYQGRSEELTWEAETAFRSAGDREH